MELRERNNPGIDWAGALGKVSIAIRKLLKNLLVKIILIILTSVVLTTTMIYFNMTYDAIEASLYPRNWGDPKVIVPFKFYLIEGLTIVFAAASVIGGFVSCIYLLHKKYDIF